MEVNKYQIFIASSLHLKEHRETISQAICEVNASEIAKANGISFCDFRYENRPDITQKLEKHDAQEPVDHALRQSPIFFLIIDDEVKSLTQYEFELALQRFNRNQMPQFIYIFHKDKTAEIGSEEGISYKQLEKEYNLNEYFNDSKGRTVTHKKIYDIPFNDLSEGETSLQAHVKTQLLNLINSNMLPYSGAVLGMQLDKQYFFGNDILRQNNCPTVYYRRHIVDDKIDQALENNKVVFLTGSSLSGKTRAIMEALRANKDGWIYVLNKDISHLRSKTEQIVERINGVTEYLCRENPPKLYIVIDDIEQLAKSSRKIRQALDELITTILEPKCHGILVATSTDIDDSLKSVQKDTTGVEIIKIPDMTDTDISMAAQYFRSCGITINNSCFKYHTMGALFVNLDELRDRYVAFLSCENDDDTYYDSPSEQKAMKLIRKRLLRAIKAQSIWRDDVLGNLTHLRELTQYFLLTDEYNVDADSFDHIFDDAVNKLCAGGMLGITIGGDNMLDVQEYVCRYFIGYDGALQKDTDRTTEVKAERGLIRHILKFSQLHITDELLVFQVSRITSRCQFKQENVSWLFGLWSGYRVEPSDEELASLLQKDQKECESLASQNTKSTVIHHYSKIIENYIYQCCDFQMAWEVFNTCHKQMRTDHLLCSVMRMAKNEDQRNQITNQSDYIRLRNDSYVIRAEVEWAQDYYTAAEAIKRMKNEETAAHVAERLMTPNEKQYDIIQLTGSINTLFTKITNEDEFNDSLRLLRVNYVKLIKDHSLLEKIKNNTLIVEPPQLSIIDLLARVGIYELGICIEKVYGNDIDSGVSLLTRITSSLSNTLTNGLTSETEVRLLISSIGCRLIKSIAQKGGYFDDIYNSLFTALKIPHPTKKEAVIIFRNSYTYTAMMLCKDCDIVKAINLFENDLVLHAADANNPIYINRYTLNELLKKCNKEEKSYLKRVNILFTQLEVERDTFSYYNLLRGGRDNDLSLSECIGIVKQMKALHVNHSVFTLTALMGCKDINLSKSLYFMRFPAGVLHDFKVEELPEEIYITSELKKSLSKHDEAWSQIVSKPCPTFKEKEVISHIMKYLELPENISILQSGKVHNALINNHYYLPDTNATVDYIRLKQSKGLFQPDSYTICHILDKVGKEKGDPRRTALYKLNGLLKENPSLINDITIISNRLKLYTSHMEQLPILFIRPDGQLIEGEMNPIKNAEIMQQIGIYINQFFIRTFTSKSLVGITDNICRRLMQVLQAQESIFSFDSQTSEAIRERLGSYLDCYPLHLVSLSVLSHNKNVTMSFRHGKIDINTALSQLDWTNENSATTEFNAIILYYIKSKMIKNSSLFTAVMDYYFLYFGGDSKHNPSSYTFSALSQAISCINDFKYLLAEIRVKREKNPRIIMQPMMLSRLSAVVHHIDELAKETKSFINDGGQADDGTADHYLHRIATYMYKTDKENVIPLLTDVFHFIIFGGDADKALRFKEREYLLMTYYENPENVHADTLLTLIKYNDYTKEPMEVQQIVSGISDKYEKQIPQLMNLLAEYVFLEKEYKNNQSSQHQIRRFNKIDLQQKRINKLQRDYLPLLFLSLKPHSRPNLSNNVVKFLAQLLPRYDIKAYNSFLHQLYTTGCSNIDDAVPELVNCIHRLSERHVHDKDVLKAVRKTEAQIFTYAELKRLRCGHLLIEKAPSEYKDWCHISLNSEYINKLLEGKFSNDRESFNDRIRFSINNLDDAYPCCLMTLRKHHPPQTPIDSETLKLIEKLQVRYTKDINYGIIKFRQMIHLPLLWLQSEWLPSEEIVTAMIRAYIAIENENSTYYEHVTKMLQSLTASIVFARLQKNEKAKVRYTALGKFKTDVKGHCLLSAKNLAAVIYQPLLYRWKALIAKGIKPTQRQIAGIKIVECFYADNIIRSTTNLSVISNLPAIWYNTGWRPQPEFVLVLIRCYTIQGTFPKKIEYNLKSIIKAQKLAEKKGWEFTKIFWGDLGRCPNSCKCFVPVSTKELKLALAQPTSN